MHLAIRLTKTQRLLSVEHGSFTGVEEPSSTSRPLQPTRSFTYSTLQAPSRNYAKALTKSLNAMPRQPNTRQIQEQGAQGQDAQGDHCLHTSFPSKKACNRPCKQLAPIENLYHEVRKSWTVSGLLSYACARETKGGSP